MSDVPPAVPTDQSDDGPRKPVEAATQPSEPDVTPLVQVVRPGEEPVYRLRYVGGLEAVEENFKTLSHGDEVDVPANRAADLCDHDPADWEPVGAHPVRVQISEEG